MSVDHRAGPYAPLPNRLASIIFDPVEGDAGSRRAYCPILSQMLKNLINKTK